MARHRSAPTRGSPGEPRATSLRLTPETRGQIHGRNQPEAEAEKNSRVRACEAEAEAEQQQTALSLLKRVKRAFT
jgi:hypothetical protein